MSRFRMSHLRANNVLELYQQRQLIDMEPAYQRLSVWDRENQARFIDSIINGVDIPKLYFHEVTGQPSLDETYRYAVIDGKQRLLAMFEFIENKFKLWHDFVYFDNETYQAASLRYEQLLVQYPLLRARFDGFNVPVVLVEVEDIEMIEELFWRLNIQTALTAPEKRNALGGPITPLIREMVLHPFFKRSIAIRNNRYQHLDLAAKFLYIIHADGVVETKKVTLDNFVRTFKRARADGEAIASPEAIGALKRRTWDILDREREYFGNSNALLGSVGRNTLYFHAFRICAAVDEDVPFSLPMLERFNADVTMARVKSQRMARGATEQWASWEEGLVGFDREKQSPNDSGAIERQYRYLANYMRREFGVQLPVPD